MRTGLSWDFSAYESWDTILAEIVEADAMGFDSAWVREERGHPLACTQPTLFLTTAARKTTTIQLRSAGRQASTPRAGRKRPAAEISIPR